MKGGWKLLGSIALLSVLVIVSFFSGFVVGDVSKVFFGASPAPPTANPASSSTSLVFVHPAAISDETLQLGSYLEVSVNISDVTDLFAWQVNMSWDPSILSVNRIIAGEFLLRASPAANTSSSPHPYGLGFVINDTNNAAGYTAMGESVLGGVPGISGDGTLVSIEFLVTGYGSTSLTISLTGNLATTLLNSSSGTLSFTTTDGYFRNKYPGDVDGDKYVGSGDFSVLAGAYGSSLGDPAYNREADFDLDGYIGSGDFSALAGNYGKTFP